MPYFYHNHGKWLSLSNFCCVFWVYKYYYDLFKTLKSLYIEILLSPMDGCYTHVKPKIVTKKDIKDIKDQGHIHTYTHTSITYIQLYIYTHIIYIYIYIYIYAYTYTGFDLMSCDS